jgi:hypothetical protein
MSCIEYTNENHSVYIDSGTHNYTLISYYSVDYPFMNVIFTLRPYYSSSSFSSSNIDTYPIILTNNSVVEDGCAFYLYDNISSSFYYLKFLIGSASDYGRFIIFSFNFIFYLNMFCRL